MLARGTLLALHRWCWLRPASTAIHTSASATAPVSSSDSADHKDGHVEQKLKAKNRWYHLGWRYDMLLKKTNLFQADDLRQFVASALSIGTYAGAGAAGLGTLGVDMTPFTAAVSGENNMWEQHTSSYSLVRHAVPPLTYVYSDRSDPWFCCS